METNSVGRELRIDFGEQVGQKPIDSMSHEMLRRVIEWLECMVIGHLAPLDSGIAEG